MMPGDASRDTWWAVGWLAGITIVTSVLLKVLLGPLRLTAGSSSHTTAVLAFVGVLVTAAATVIGLTVTRQSGRAAERRLRLDAAMRAGESFSISTPEGISAASIASSLLALTKLDNADLAVALLVDFWEPGAEEKISAEAAILVVDAALRSAKASAQLVAAELLCRNADHLDPCQSLHWPSAIDGCWNHRFSPKTKLLLVDALILMTKADQPASPAALRSIAVRLYGIFDGDPDANVKGCIATLIEALLPALRNLGYKNFMQGNKMVMLSQLEATKASIRRNDDEYLARMVMKRAKQLKEWASLCVEQDHELAPGELATATVNPGHQRRLLRNISGKG
jgi:hypothetical protein